MSGFASLSRLGATFRPIDVWPAGDTRYLSCPLHGSRGVPR